MSRYPQVGDYFRRREPFVEGICVVRRLLKNDKLIIVDFIGVENKFNNNHAYFIESFYKWFEYVPPEDAPFAVLANI